MSSCVKVVISATLVACHHTPSARERALALLPAEPTIVAVADGPALAGWRRAVDVARPYVPPAFQCVIDAAVSADAAALAHGSGGTTVVIVTRAPIEGCSAVARVAADTYVATIGDSTIEHGLGKRWQRAEPYLATAPIALAADLGTRHVLAGAGPAAAWLAIDGADPGAVKAAADASVARWRSLGSKLSVTRTGSQVLVRATALDPEEVATVASDLLRELDPPDHASAPTFTCPPVGGVVVHCTGTSLTVRSLADALAQVAAQANERVVAQGDVIGLRIAAPVLLLAKGDILLGIDAHRITSAAQLAQLAGRLPKRVSVAIRRGEIDAVIEVAEE